MSAVCNPQPILLNPSLPLLTGKPPLKAAQWKATPQTLLVPKISQSQGRSMEAMLELNLNDLNDLIHVNHLIHLNHLNHLNHLLVEVF